MILSNLFFFLFSHHLSAWYCIEILEVSSVPVTRGIWSVKRTFIFVDVHGVSVTFSISEGRHRNVRPHWSSRPPVTRVTETSAYVSICWLFITESCFLVAFYLWVVHTKGYLEDKMDAQTSLSLSCCGGHVLWVGLGWHSVERQANWMCFKTRKSRVITRERECYLTPL